MARAGQPCNKQVPELGRLAEEKGLDLIFSRGNAAAGRNAGQGAGVCMGFYFARATNASSSTFQIALRRILEKNSPDQPALIAVLWPHGNGRDPDSLKPDYWVGESPVTKAKFALLPQTRFARHAGRPTHQHCTPSTLGPDSTVAFEVWLCVFSLIQSPGWAHSAYVACVAGSKLLDFAEGVVDLHVFHPVDTGYELPLHLLPTLLSNQPALRNATTAKQHCGVGKWFERIVWRKREQQIQGCMGLWLLRKYYKYGVKHWPPLATGQDFVGWLESVSYVQELTKPVKPKKKA